LVLNKKDREGDRGLFLVSVILVYLGKGFAFVLGAHFNISFSISGFFDDIREEFSSDTEKQN